MNVKYKKVGIYKITNPNNECYIGGSTDILTRFKSHKNINKTNKKMQDSYNKYGIENHTFQILEECEVSDLLIKESEYQLKFNSINMGLNIVLNKPNKRKDSNDIRAKLSEDGIDYGYTLGEACELLGISRPTLYEWIDRKIIKIVVYGLSKRVQKKEIDNYLKQFKN